MTGILRRRLVSLVPTLFITTFVVFALQQIIPGGPAEAIAGGNADARAIATIRAQLGLDRPFVVQYADWLGNAARGNLGTSYYTHEPVTRILAERAVPTLELVGGAVLLALLLGCSAGCFAAIRRWHTDGRTLFAMTALGISVPDFWVALIAAGVFGLTLGLFPAVGYTPPTADLLGNLHSVALPVVVLSIPSGALISRHIRSAMVAALESTHVRTAWAMGLPPSEVYLRHAARIAITPVVTFLPAVVAGLVGASVLVESVFNIPGLGSEIVATVSNRDYPALQGIVLALAIVVLLLNLLADVVLTLIDPRIRKGIG